MDCSTFCVKCRSGVACPAGQWDRMWRRGASHFALRRVGYRHSASVQTRMPMDGVRRGLRTRASPRVVRIACRGGLTHDPHGQPRRCHEPVGQLCLAALAFAAGALTARPALGRWGPSRRIPANHPGAHRRGTYLGIEIIADVSRAPTARCSQSATHGRSPSCIHGNGERATGRRP